MSAEQQEQIAAAWLAREDRGLSVQEQAAMQSWLIESALNRVAYLRLKAVWENADRLAALRVPGRDSVAAQAPRVSYWKLLAATILLLGLGSAGMLYLRGQQPSMQIYATQVGDTQHVRLADGSSIVLNTNSRVRTEVTSTSRMVTLDSGEVYFDIVHDETRPFVVYAGNRRITDLGTRFSVYRNGDDVRVIVQEGRVRVDVVGDAQTGAPVVVTGGHAIITHGAEMLLVAKPSQDITDDLSWREGKLVFNQQSLAEVAKQFNRYNRQRILVEGTARKIRIGGSFKADNVAGFAALLHQGFGLTVNKRGNDIVVSR